MMMMKKKIDCTAQKYDPRQPIKYSRNVPPILGVGWKSFTLFGIEEQKLSLQSEKSG
jgi:hypothetical protein